MNEDIAIMEEERLEKNWRKKIALMSLLMLTVLGVCGCSKTDHKESDKKEKIAEAIYNSNYEAVEAEGILFEMYEDKAQAFVMGYSDVELQKVVIPDKILYEDKAYLVTSIAESAFESNQTITSVKMGKNITEIESSAFYACPELKKIELTDTSRIGEEAFAECVSLQEIDWGDAVEMIGNNAFRGCQALESVSLPGSISEWGTGIFTDCVSLQQCIFETGITSVGDGIFSNCDSLEKAEIPETVTAIGAEAFWGCMALTELTLSDHITSIGDRAFYSTGITKLRMPEKLSGVKLELLDGMYALEEIEVPESKLEIYEEVFENYGIDIATY